MTKSRRRLVNLIDGVRKRVQPTSASGRGLLAVAAGTGAGQAILLAIAPLLSRIYDPADFGVLTFVSGCGAIVGAISTLRLESAIPLATRRVQSYSLLVIGLLACAGTTLCAYALVAIAQLLPEQLLGSELAVWLWAAPTLAMTIGLFNLFNQTAIREQRYSAIGRRYTVQALLTGVMQIGMGWAGLRPAGLIIGLGIGQFSGAVSLARLDDLKEIRRTKAYRARRLKATLIHFRRFPAILAPSTLLNVAGIAGPGLMVTLFYGTEVGGWLGITQRIIALPVMLSVNSVGQVYLAEAARTVRAGHGGLAGLFTKTTQRLLVISALLTTAVIATAGTLFPLALGPEWTMSGLYAQILALNLGAQVVAGSLSPTLTVLQCQLTQLGWDATRLVASCGAVAACAAMGASPTAAVASYSAISTASYVVLWFLCDRAVKRSAGHSELGPQVRMR